MSGKRWLSAVEPSAASDPVRGGARSAAISWDLLLKRPAVVARVVQASWIGCAYRHAARTPRSGSSAHAGLRRRGEPAWTGTGLLITRLRLRVSKRRLSASRRQYVARTRAQPPAETSQQHITAGLFPRSHNMTCTDSTTDRTGSPDCTGVSQPSVPRLSHRPRLAAVVSSPDLLFPGRSRGQLQIGPSRPRRSTLGLKRRTEGAA